MANDWHGFLFIIQLNNKNLSDIYIMQYQILHTYKFERII